VRADRDESTKSLSAVIGAFLDAAHGVPPHQLPALVATAAHDLGAIETRIWLADHEQRALVHLTQMVPLEPIPIEGTAAGRAFTISTLIEPPDAEGPRHVWLPLLDGVDRIGVLELVVDAPTDDQLWAFRHLASMATAEIITRGQYTDQFTRARRRRAMTVAAELQWQNLPPSNFATEDVSVAGMLEPAYDVGGDSFDYAHDLDRLDVAILDGVGHDLGSSLTCALALGAYRNSRREGGDLRHAAALMDLLIKEELGAGRFATGVLANLHTDTGVFRWLNAGHPLPLLIRDGHMRSLECRPRLPFGIGHIQPDRDWEVAETQLQPGDGILLFTDGVIEARKPGGEDFGLDRLMEFLHTAFAAGLGPPETLRRLSHAIVDFHTGILRDDATTLLVVWKPEA
jgi:serine phosphatase RsbU (regulator of sigma subunit)